MIASFRFDAAVLPDGPIRQMLGADWAGVGLEQPGNRAAVRLICASFMRFNGQPAENFSRAAVVAP